jgi:uncharacterized protein (DUF362 family)
MEKYSRRKILKLMLSGAVTAAAVPLLEACQAKPLPTGQAPTSSTDAPTVDSAVPMTSPSGTNEPASTAVTYPHMAVTHNAKPEALVRAAINELGGMGRFVPQNGWVIIKPNICTDYHSYEYAATTNPWVVGELVRLCFEAGAAKVQVMDSPFGGSAASAYQNSGIAEQVELNGGEMVQMSGFKFKEVKLENARSLKKVEIYEDVFKADALINVPIAKNHGMATLTLGMKNLMGLITNRSAIHKDFGKRLTDLALTIRPTLTVIDAVRVLLRNGPTGGDLNDVRQMDTVIASPDIVATDAYAASLFGLLPENLDYVVVGNQAGLGEKDMSRIEIRELYLEA